MKTRHFVCPKCEQPFEIRSYWRWVWQAPFHWFCFHTWTDWRYTRCPHCGCRSLNTWHTITRD